MPLSVDARMPRAIAAFAMLFAAAVAPAAAQGDAFPSRPLRYVVPYAPGGPTDTVGRLVAAELSKRLGQQVIVDNRPGANANIGAEFVAKAPADGYTLLQGTSSTHGSNPALYPKLPYDAQRDFVAVIPLIEGPVYLGVGPKSAANTTAELLAFARANPGKLNYGTPGPGSPQHLAGELLKLRAGIDMVAVHFKGAAPAMTALLGGEIDIVFDSTALAQARAGKLKVLGVSTRKRWPLAPDVPTLEEGGVAGFEVRGWFGLFAPRATPGAVVERLNREINDVLALPAVRTRLTEMGYQPVGGGAAAFAESIRAETATWAAVVKAANLTLE
jgi:tripartite-type tricarboxylate transporter receptor subunit TctC